MQLEKYMLPCLSKTLFGVECLGCGFQRAFVWMLKGDFVKAFLMYPALYPMILFGLFWSVSRFDKRHDYRFWIRFFGFSSLIFAVCGYIYKHY